MLGEPIGGSIMTYRILSVYDATMNAQCYYGDFNQVQFKGKGLTPNAKTIANAASRMLNSAGYRVRVSKIEKLSEPEM